ncbi:hypothetical protein [Plantibacter sp. T3]|uniref:hypothetical protein n=1 Tax=Plantibacter sp. T3 TaxID=2653161 RepID=UPI00135BBE41|nr:hypothetical protein [Plantibacter sp. T3]
MTNLQDALHQTIEASAAVSRLRSQGWSAIRTLSVVTLSRSGGSPTDLLFELDSVPTPFDSIAAVGAFGDASLAVVTGKEGHRTVTQQSVIDIPRTFNRDTVDAASDAWAGDVDAALSLPGVWTVTMKYDFSAILATAEPSLGWQVLPGVSDVESMISSTPVWALGPTWDAEKPVIFVLEDLNAQQMLRLGRSAIVPLSSEVTVAEVAHALCQLTPTVWRIAELPEAASPAALAPSLRYGTELAALEHAMWLRCATMAWVGLSTSVKFERSAASVLLEVFGLQRVAHRVGSDGISISEAQARRAYELFVWASGSDAVDQRLAVQQVASLYRDVPPWGKSGDVFDAAVAVFATLRRDAVSEVLLARRAARTFAVDVAHRATEQTAATARSTVERCVATLLAIGGVIIARTTKAITEGQAHDLRTLLALFLLGLIVWNITIEGPPVSSPLKSLRQDLDTVADLLTESERDDILRLSAVRAASRRATVIRIAVPAVYLAAAIAAWTVS